MHSGKIILFFLPGDFDHSEIMEKPDVSRGKREAEVNFWKFQMVWPSFTFPASSITQGSFDLAKHFVATNTRCKEHKNMIENYKPLFHSIVFKRAK